MRGRGYGLIISYSIGALCLIAHSILNAFQNITCAYAAVVVHTFARMFATIDTISLYYIFPPTHFGLVQGILTLTSIPVQFINVPLFKYIQENNYDFQTMNFVLAGLSTLLFLYPLVIWSRHIQKRNEYFDKQNSEIDTQSVTLTKSVLYIERYPNDKAFP